jgi:hypothetical protein
MRNVNELLMGREVPCCRTEKDEYGIAKKVMDVGGNVLYVCFSYND